MVGLIVAWCCDSFFFFFCCVLAGVAVEAHYLRRMHIGCVPFIRPAKHTRTHTHTRSRTLPSLMQQTRFVVVDVGLTPYIACPILRQSLIPSLSVRFTRLGSPFLSFSLSLCLLLLSYAFVLFCLLVYVTCVPALYKYCGPRFALSAFFLGVVC